MLNFDISYKILIGPKPLRIRLDKIDGFTRIYDGSRYLTLFGKTLLKNMMLFMTELDIL